MSSDEAYLFQEKTLDGIGVERSPEMRMLGIRYDFEGDLAVNANQHTGFNSFDCDDHWLMRRLSQAIATVGWVQGEIGVPMA